MEKDHDTKDTTMARTYDIGGKQIDLDDTDAIRALTPDELTTLLTLTQQTPPEPGDTAPAFPTDQPPDGTGFIFLPTPPTTDR